VVPERAEACEHGRPRPEEATVRRALGSLIIGVCVLIALPASAATRDDPDDVPGSLDLKQVSRTFSNGPSTPPMVHFQATTYDSWRLRECANADACSIAFEINALDAFWSAHRESGETRQSCRIFRHDQLIATGVSTKFRHSVFCSFEKRLLRKAGPVDWRVSSLWGVTLDRAPDSGWYGDSRPRPR
jgi:hypothetical protein